MSATRFPITCSCSTGCANTPDDFDILHFHIDQFHFPLFRPMANRTVTTIHGRQDLPDLKPLYIGFSDMPLVSISNAQRKPVANANFVATVLHGIPAQLLKPTYDPGGGYLAFLGRISPEKRRIVPLSSLARSASRSGSPPRSTRSTKPISARPPRRCSTSRAWSTSGRSTSAPRASFWARRALLFPIDWPEPFGLSMIEAMAPHAVLAFRCGSVPEIVDPGVTGLIVDTMEEAVKTLPQVLLDRRAVRRRFEERFSATRMAKNYLQVYHSLLSRESMADRDASVPPLQPVWKKR